MARGRLYYEQRMRARAVSKHALAPLPEPTLADTMATVYHQRWVVGPGREILGLDVLARDAAHAVMLGEMTLSLSGIDPPFYLDVNIACPDASVEVKGRILNTESKSIKEHRQQMWKDREGREAADAK